MGAVAIVQRVGAGYRIAGSIDDGKMRGVGAFAEADDGVWWTLALTPEPQT